ncbi:MAG: 1-acyl-sn-glycerol-3-phosphate acyltransferase [Myxococcales bacterium]|nr:MAG: 1-acyl-sn-glycerol-3-phosphate acyltransferase [Myxococcales bacterium]
MAPTQAHAQIECESTPEQFLSAEEGSFIRSCRAVARMFLFLFLTLAYAAWVVCLSLVGKADSRHVARLAQRWAARLIEGMGIRLEVEGVPPPDGALLVANHRSYIDIVAVLSQVPCTMLAKAEVGRWPFIGWAARLGNTVFVSRDDRTSRKLARASIAELMRQGLSTVVFPEGTTSAGPGCLPFRPGVFHLAAENGIPVVPVAIEYADPEDCWVGDDTFIRHFFDRFGRRSLSVRVGFGPVLRPSEATILKESAERWVAENLRKPTTTL